MVEKLLSVARISFLIMLVVILPMVTKGTDLTFTEFAEVFGVYDILNSSGAQTGCYFGYVHSLNWLFSHEL